MPELTAEGQRITQDLAQRYGVSVDAVTSLLHALVAGGGTMAQFSHPELGGMGQWSQGGMIMIGDMFNNALKARVDGICNELAGILAREPLLARPAAFQSQSQSQGGGGMSSSMGASFGDVSLFVPQAGGGNWWPGDLGSPSSVGAQNDIRYAVFPATRRLAVQIGGRTTVYDTLDHQIGGVSQQQGGDASLTFTSQRGVVRVSELPVIGPQAAAAPAPQSSPPAAASASPPPAAAAPAAPPTPAAPAAAEPVREAASPPKPATPAGNPASAPAGDVFATLERLADLRSKGIVSDEEFAAKKAELLSRL